MTEHNPRAGLPPLDMSREFNAIGGLWEQTDRAGRPYLKGQLAIAGMKLTILGYPPKESRSDNPPTFVLSVVTADLAELETRLDELRTSPGSEHPF